MSPNPWEDIRSEVNRRRLKRREHIKIRKKRRETPSAEQGKGGKRKMHQPMMAAD